MPPVEGTEHQQVVDELAIRNLLNRVAILGDGDEFDAYTACFTEDATWESSTEVIQGHEAIRASAVQRFTARQQTLGPDTCHLVTNQIVDIDGPDTASSQSYMVFLADTRSQPVPRAVARYHDTIRRTPDGWKMARRRITLG